MRRIGSAWWCAGGVALLAPAAALPDQAYLREEDAPRAVFPEATAASRRTLDLTDAERAALSATMGRRVEVKSYPYWAVRAGERTAGLVFVLDVQGQTLPITFAVGVDPGGALRDVQVMVYREPRGEEIRESRFRRQFAGKRLKDPVALGRDIEAVSGATISSRSAAYAARKALALAEILRARGGPEAR